jgi:hypothetical protein
MKVYCNRCEKATPHRKKLYDIVCNKCDTCNYPVFLKRIGDGRSNVGHKVIWIEWDNGGRGKGVHQDPQIGFSLCIDLKVAKPAEELGLTDFPVATTWGWMTTEVTEILEDKQSKEYRLVKFKTKNSEYVLHSTGI